MPPGRDHHAAYEGLPGRRCGSRSIQAEVGHLPLRSRCMSTPRQHARTDLGQYLRSRREAIDPGALDLPVGRRQVQGLRREEVAAFAGVSVDYYTRLEQGREKHPSPNLMDALSRVLQLDADETLHLYRLAGADPTPRTRRDAASPDHLQPLIDRWPLSPAFVYNDAQDIHIANPLGGALHRGFAQPDNFAHMIFLDPHGRRFFVEWERVAADTVGVMRQAWGKLASRAGLQPIVDELRTCSSEFRELWETHEVVGKIHHTKTLEHPEVGRMTLEYRTFDIPAAHDQHLLICDAAPESDAERTLRRLAHVISTT